MPTSIASVIALFAANAAVKDLQGTSHMTNKEREQYVKELDHRYGYGSYIGNDGAVHVGIEKFPYVQDMKEVTFRGSRAEREMRKRSEMMAQSEPLAATGAATGAEYVHVPLEDVEEGVQGPTSVRRNVVSEQSPRVEYTPVAVGELDFADDISVISSLSRSFGVSRGHERGPEEERMTLFNKDGGDERCVSPLDDLPSSSTGEGAHEGLENVER